ncbi:T-cell activation Rho GTPase-activating protein-like isoform X2 [Carassius carassius]|uniref:T-cell activation Rho GTPase-activating protein-like isoform X2 n=1 Tax=Carassius carassius TaxID=217509 RepID=UPI002868F163|nr:T-cell activation Rho GTPase-activating protein-like isoform X2 [Carassius carassius]
MRRRGSYDGTTAPIQPHLRGLAQRRRSAPNLVLGKALGMSWSPIREEAQCLVAVDQCPFVLGLTSEHSELILDECAQLTDGLKTRERHLFLLSDALVIAKLKSNASYRLKHRIDLKDLWVCSFENDDEAEDEDTDVDLRTSIILAWSVSLCLASFCLPELKDHWLDTLHRKTAEARSRAGNNSPPPSVLMKVLSGNTTNKTLSGVGMDSAELPLDGNDKISTLSKQFHNQEAHTQQPIGENGSKRNFFFKLKRSSTNISVPAHPESSAKNLLFGRHLQDDATLPKPITEILLLLFRKGPLTEGVFRVSCNSKKLNALKDQLNSGAQVDMEDLPVTLLVGLLKIFLKEIPGCLLVFEHYESWISALETERKEDAQRELRRMAERLPKANSLLLQHLVCLFHHISQRSETNKMDARNLAVCIAPTLLHPDSQPLDRDDVAKATHLIQFLIENCCEVFGNDILKLFEDLEDQDSIYKSDSASLVSPDISFDVHRHDSAYDSTDPDVDCDCVEAESQTQEDNMTAHGSPGLCKLGLSDIHSCSSDTIFDTFTKPFNRRCSEPSIFPSAPIMDLRELARSHDDFSTEKEDFDDQPLKKQNSDDSFLHPKSCENRRSQMFLKKLVRNMDLPISVSSPTSKAGSCQSFCSSESTSSNLSEQSTTSPLPSPASPRKSTRHSSFMSKSKHSNGQGDLEGTRRSLSVRAKSLGNFTFNRGSLKKGESKKEVVFPCETLQEDSQNERDNVDELVRRRRPLSAIEVFQHVDSRMPCSPPSYEQALQTGAQPAPPQYRAMTVQHARELDRKSRPISMNDYLLDNYKVNESIEYIETFTESVRLEEPQPVSFRQRAMSESVSQSRHEQVSHRCSQPVFEEFSYAKESYV